MRVGNSMGFSLPHRAAHVLSAAHGRFDLAMTIGAFGDLDLRPITQFQVIVDQRGIAFGTSRVDRHAAFCTFVGRHIKYPLMGCNDRLLGSGR